MAKLEIDFDKIFGPSARRFIWAAPPGETGVIEKCAMGERGTGKTDAGLAAVCHHAWRMPEECRPIPWIFIRDTWANIERTLLPSILKPPHTDSFPGLIRKNLRYRNGGQYIEYPGLWYANLFGVDSMGDLEKLRVQIGGVWVEEPAPAAVDDIGTGMEQSVITIAKSSLRHGCPWRVAQVTMNYPDEEHWTWKRYGENTREDIRLIKIPKGENPKLTGDYYEQMAKDFAHDPGLLQRLVLGQPGFVPQGELVTPEFGLDTHKLKLDPEPYPGAAIRFWDGGLNPTCIFTQITPRGFMRIYPWTQVGQGVGVKQLIRDAVKPISKECFPGVYQWRDIGDPSMANSEQSDSEQSAARIIEQDLGTVFEGGTVEWRIRREAMKRGLIREIDGQPWIQIAASERQLTRALRGGWHYRRDAGGRVLRDGAVKDMHSHPGDAFSYGVTRLLTYIDRGILTHLTEGQRFKKPQVLSSHDWHPLGG